MCMSTAHTRQPTGHAPTPALSDPQPASAGAEQRRYVVTLSRQLPRLHPTTGVCPVTADLMMPVKLASSGRFPTHKMSALASRGLTFVTWQIPECMRHSVLHRQLWQTSSSHQHLFEAGLSCLKPRRAEGWVHVSVCPLCLADLLPLQS